MKKLLKQILKESINAKGVILLPEANIDERVRTACEFVIKNKLCDIAVLGKAKEMPTLKSCKFYDIEDEELQETLANQLYDLRKSKGTTLEDAKELIKLPQYFSMMLLHTGMVDGVVAGAKWSTADVLRPALQIIKTKPGKTICVGTMIMIKKNEKPLLFSDISLNLDPTSEQLAEIAVSSAEFMKNVLNIEPKVAMLSYSTKGSGKGEMVDKVVKATEIAKQSSNFAIEGEMQADVALDIITAKNKNFENEVSGKANVLVFPDINAGNIGYKLVARLGKYLALGPIILNLNKPVNDLSRGCNVEEIIYTTCITKLLIGK